MFNYSCKKTNHQDTKDTKNITILSSRAKSRDLKLIDSDEIPPLLIVGRNGKYIRVHLCSFAVKKFEPRIT